MYSSLRVRDWLNFDLVRALENSKCDTFENEARLIPEGKWTTAPQLALCRSLLRQGEQRLS